MEVTGNVQNQSGQQQRVGDLGSDHLCFTLPVLAGITDPHGTAPHPTCEGGRG